MTDLGYCAKLQETAADGDGAQVQKLLPDLGKYWPQPAERDQYALTSLLLGGADSGRPEFVDLALDAGAGVGLAEAARKACILGSPAYFRAVVGTDPAVHTSCLKIAALFAHLSGRQPQNGSRALALRAVAKQLMIHIN